MPIAIVGPVLLAGLVWKMMIISLIGTGFQAFLWVYIVIDRLFDYFVRIFLGQIGFLRPLAWLAIWAFKIPTFPIIAIGWAWTVLINVMAFPIQGWMLFFGGSGCFLRWGYNCGLGGKRLKNRSYYQIADLAWLLTDPGMALRLPAQNYAEFS